MERISTRKPTAHEKLHAKKLRKLAPECMVLLKSNNDFPIKPGGKIALYGSGARRTVKGGTGSGDVNSRTFITVERGLERAGFEITTKSWLDSYDHIIDEARVKFIKDIKKRAKEQGVPAMTLGMGAVMPEPDYGLMLDGEGECAIYVLSRICGEGNDRLATEGDLKLTRTEIRDIIGCNRRYKKFMLVLNVGGVVDLSPVMEVDNILLMSQLGFVTGVSLLDVITGKAYPSGKLTATWSAWEDYPSVGDFGNKDDTRYKEGVYVGYRYFDSVGKRALFPFGYGLSYTAFSTEYKEARICGKKIVVEAEVKNTGAYKGKEIVQLYVTQPWGRLDYPYQRLVAFDKTKELLPGESCTVQLCFDAQLLAGYDRDSASYIIEKGTYILRIGADSVNTSVCAAIETDNEITVRRLSNIGGETDFEDWKPDYTWGGKDITDDTPVLRLCAEELQKLYDADKKPDFAVPDEEALNAAKKLSDEELCYMCIGSHSDGNGLLSVIGSASKRVAGAAGESCDRVEGIAPIIMADGPAGIRINRQYALNEKGVQPIGISMPAGMEEFIPGFAKALIPLFHKKPKGKRYYQFCTAMPIGTAMAQSWNTSLAQEFGDIVGSEMEVYGIQLWLAPAFNIQRNPLCGRNFEYYSEDPFLSGALGAAITRGVQEHKGCGVVIKHFCCNNQETNRYQSNSAVNERAMREIYMKPFEICIRLSNPMALMSSYNLLNGVHTSQREDLNRKILRDEWGWDGMIMTDWVIPGMCSDDAKYPVAVSDEAIGAGTNLFMPGNQSDYRTLLEALNSQDKDKKLSRSAVEECAAYVIQLSKKLNADEADISN